MSINLEIPEENSQNTVPPSYKSKEVIKLTDLNDFEISELFATLSAEGRNVIVPIGFPAAGKSLLFASLLWYGEKCTDAKFEIHVLGNKSKGRDDINTYFANGQIVQHNMVKDFDDKKLYARNRIGSFDLIGINLEPTRFKSDQNKFPIFKLAFLDLAGEDLKNITISEGGEFNTKIDAVFKGLEADNSGITFLLITPFEPYKKDDESSKNAHSREDDLHAHFLNYIEVNRPHLYEKSKFILVVSQWDKNKTYSNAEAFIQDKRPAVYQKLKNSGRAVWGEYSVGIILENEIEGGVIKQKIHKQNIDYPSRLWKKLYQISTGKDLDAKSFWEKLFG